MKYQESLFAMIIGVALFLSPIASPGIFGESTDLTSILIGLFLIVLGIALAVRKEKKKTCRRCGKPYPDDALYCDLCGLHTR